MIPDNRSIISHSDAETSGKERSKGYSKRLMTEISLTNTGEKCSLYTAWSQPLRVTLRIGHRVKYCRAVLQKGLAILHE